MNKQFVGGNLAAAAAVFPNKEKEGREMLVFTVMVNMGKTGAGVVIPAEPFPCIVHGEAGSFANILPYLTVGTGVECDGELIYTEQGEKDGTVYDNILVQLRSLRDLKLVGGSKGRQDTPAADLPDQNGKDQQDAQQAQAAVAQGAADHDSFDDDIPF